MLEGSWHKFCLRACILWDLSAHGMKGGFLCCLSTVPRGCGTFTRLISKALVRPFHWLVWDLFWVSTSISSRLHVRWQIVSLGQKEGECWCKTGFVFLGPSEAVEKLIWAVDSGLAVSHVAGPHSGQGRSLWRRFLFRGFCHCCAWAVAVSQVYLSFTVKLRLINASSSGLFGWFWEPVFVLWALNLWQGGDSNGSPALQASALCGQGF